MYVLEYRQLNNVPRFERLSSSLQDPLNWVALHLNGCRHGLWKPVSSCLVSVWRRPISLELSCLVFAIRVGFVAGACLQPVYDLSSNLLNIWSLSLWHPVNRFLLSPTSTWRVSLRAAVSILYLLRILPIGALQHCRLSAPALSISGRTFQVDLNLCWTYAWFCWFCRAVALVSSSSTAKRLPFTSQGVEADTCFGHLSKPFPMGLSSVVLKVCSATSYRLSHLRARFQLQHPTCPIPDASPLAHHYRTCVLCVGWGG